MSSDTNDLDIPCLGRPFQLGELYDCRNDCVVGSVVPKMLQQSADQMEQPKFKLELICSDSLASKTHHLGIQGNTKLSVLMGLVNTAGSAKYFNDRKSSSRLQARVTLKCSCTTKFEKLDIGELSAIHNPKATHIVKGVLYGTEAFFVFDQEVTPDENNQTVQEKMKKAIEHLPDKVVIKDMSKVQCTVYGDIQLQENPTSFQNAAKLLKKLPKPAESSSRAIPMRVILCPLSKLPGSVVKMPCEISPALVTDAEKFVEDFHQLQMQCNDLLKAEVPSKFPGIGKQLSHFQDIMNTYKSNVIKQLAGLLPLVRGGETPEAKMTQIFRENDDSPFGSQRMFKWFQKKEHEVRLLAVYLKNMKEIEFIATPHDLDAIVYGLKLERVICFSFPATGEDDAYLQCLSDYIQTPQVKQRLGDALPLQWHEDKNTVEDMRFQAQQFQNFFEANRTQRSTKFVVSSRDALEISGSEGAVTVLINAVGIPENFFPPSQPGVPTPTKVTNDSIQLTWSRPKSGAESVQWYTISYSKETDSTKQLIKKTNGSENTIMITHLAPKTKYHFKVQAQYNVGKSPESEVSDPIETSPNYAFSHVGDEMHFNAESSSYPQKVTRNRPSKPIVSAITSNTVHLTWHTPESGNKNIEFYTVSYRRMDKQSEWSAVKTQSPQEFEKVSGLAANALYCFKVCAKYKLGGVSLDSELSDPISTSPALPGKPGKPTATKVTHNSIRLYWSGPEFELQSNEFYSVLYRPMCNPSAEWQIKRTMGTKEAVISGLKENTVYCIKVRAECDAGVGPDSEMSDPITTSPPPVPGRPGKPTLSKVTHNSIHLNWPGPKSSNEGVTFYSVFYRRMDDTSAKWQGTKTKDSKKEVTVSGLSAKAVYCFKVRAENEAGVSSDSEMSDPTATSPPPVPGRPGKPTAPKLTHNSIHLEWSSPTSGIESVTFYSVLYRRMDDPSAPWQTTKTEDSQNEVTVSGLAAKTVYCFKVCAESEAGVSHHSELSDPIATNPLPLPGRPGKPTASKVTHNSIHLNWPGPKPGIESVKIYSVLYRRMDDLSGEWQTIQTLDSHNTFTVSELAAKALYCFKVCAVNEAGPGSLSEMSEPILTKSPPAPGRPGKPMASKVTHNSIHLNWPGPESGIESVKFYSVLYHRMDDTSAEWQTAKTQDSQKELTVSGLAAKTLYCFKVCAESETDAGPHSELCEPIATRPAPLPERPGKPTVSKVTHNSIHLNWPGPKSGIEGVKLYSVFYRRMDDTSAKWQNTKTQHSQMEVSGLAAKAVYCFKVFAECEAGISPESEMSEPIATSPPPLPGKPGKPTASEVTHNSVRLKWPGPESDVEGVTFYSIIYRRMDNPLAKWQNTKTQDSQIEVTVSGLAAKAVYCFKVRAECEAGDSPDSDLSDPIATSPLPLPGRPGKPTAFKLAYNSIQLNWSGPISGIEGVKLYSVLYRRMDDTSAEWQITKTQDSQEEVTVSGLSAKTVYCFKVRAESEAGVSPDSEMSDPIGTSPAPLPERPGKLIASKVTHNSVYLNWSGSESFTQDIKCYVVSYCQADDPSQQWQTLKTQGAQEFIVVSGLEANAVYFFKVCAECEYGSGAESEISKIKTDPVPIPSRPGKPNASEVTHNTIDLNWSDPEDGAENVNCYTVSYCKSNGSPEHWEEKRTDGAVVSLTVPNLAARTRYRFKVRAESEAGVSHWSKVSHAIETYSQPLPSQPGKPYSSSVSHDTVVLNWNKPDCGSQDIKYYTVSYYDHDFPKKCKTEKTEGIQERIAMTGLKPRATYCFKVQAESDAGCGSYSESSDPIQLLPPPAPSQPGEPTASEDDIIHNSIMLKWAKPKIGGDYVKHYSVLYRRNYDPKDQWQTKLSDGARTILYVSGLDPKTEYWFKVNAVGENSVSVYSKISVFHTTAKVRLAEAMLSSAQMIEEGPPKVYKLQLQDIISDEGKQLKRCAIGEQDLRSSMEEKVILVLGAAGAGKSPLINGMVNYLLGVEWGDVFRFKLIVDEGDKKVNSDTAQAHSQTKWITAYTFHHQRGSPLPYTLTIIDTPGFGDTGGLERDHRITQQIKDLFSMDPPNCIDHLNAIGFVTQSTLPRLTSTQKYVFDSILAIFGKDIGNNIFMMATFADGGDPPVVSAIKEANIPFCDLFKFNNSAMYSTHSDNFSKMFWDMGFFSFEAFFAHLRTLEAQSLRLTKQVLDERQHLETIIQGLLPEIKIVMSTMDELQQEEKVLEQLQLESSDLESKEFSYKVKAVHQRMIDLKPGEYVTNCIKCNRTCHYPCIYPDDENKWKCSAMNSAGENSVCQVCPGGCAWQEHHNNQYRIEAYEKEEERTLDDLLKKLETVKSDKNAVKIAVDKIKQKVEELQQKVFGMICEAQQILARLDEIALKPNPLTELDYIDLLIESEKQEAKVGYRKRLEYLQQARHHAELISQIKEGSDAPEWLTEAVQKAREKMEKHKRSFEQNLNNADEQPSSTSSSP